MRNFSPNFIDDDLEVVYTIHGVYDAGASSVLELHPQTPEGEDLAEPTTPGLEASSSA
jgi:hypothetical protein